MKENEEKDLISNDNESKKSCLNCGNLYTGEECPNCSKLKISRVDIIGTAIIVVIGIIFVVFVSINFLENREYNNYNENDDYTSKEDKKENKEEPKLTEEEKIEKFIKNNLYSYWSYNKEDLIIDSNLNITINLYDVDDVIECYDTSKTKSQTLINALTDDININSITFACKSDETEKKPTGYIETGNIKNLSIYDYENSVKIYDENKNITTLESYKEKQKQEYKNKCKTYNYKEIFRNSENYVGKDAKFTGEVIQVLEGNSLYQIRMNVTKGSYGYYSDTIMAFVPKNAISGRILEDDIIRIYGNLGSLYTYETVLGSTVTIPSIDVLYAELVK